MNEMVMFKDALDRVTLLRPPDVSAITEGGNGYALVYLRGGQMLAIPGAVADLSKLLNKVES